MIALLILVIVFGPISYLAFLTGQATWKNYITGRNSKRSIAEQKQWWADYETRKLLREEQAKYSLMA